MRTPEIIVPYHKRNIVNPTPFGENPIRRASRIENIIHGPKVLNMFEAINKNPPEPEVSKREPDGVLSRIVNTVTRVLPKKAAATLLATTMALGLPACADNTVETTTIPPTTISSTIPQETTTTLPPTTTTPTTVPETTTTTEACPIIESSRKNLWGDIPTELGIIYKHELPNSKQIYFLINGKVNGIGQVDVENFGDTGEIHSAFYVELNFGNSGEGQDCKPVLIKIGLASKDFPYAAINLVRYTGRDFKLSNFDSRVEGIPQDLVDYINDMQQRDIEIGVGLVTNAPNGLTGSWCNDVNDPYHSICFYNTEQEKSIERNNDLVNALKEFKDTGIFPFDSLDSNAIYFAAEFDMLDHSNL